MASNLSMWIKVTRWLIFGTLLVWLAYDVFVITVAGMDASESQAITDFSANSLRMAFFSGCLVTHFFGWVMIPRKWTHCIKCRAELGKPRD